MKIHKHQPILFEQQNVEIQKRISYQEEWREDKVKRYCTSDKKKM